MVVSKPGFHASADVFSEDDIMVEFSDDEGDEIY